jgi:hypothetical protein
MKSLRDEAVRDKGAVVPGRIDELNAERHNTLQGSSRAVGVFWFTPYHRPWDLHGAEAKTPNFEVTETNRGGKMREVTHGVA